MSARKNDFFIFIKIICWLNLIKTSEIEGNYMKIYWSFNSVPELKGLNTEEQKKIWNACRWSVFRHTAVWIALLFFPVCSILGHFMGEVIGNALQLSQSLAYIVITLIGFAIGTSIGGFVFGQVSTVYIRPCLREQINKDSKSEPVNIFDDMK